MHLQEKGLKLNNYTIDGLSELGISMQNIDTLIPYLSIENFDIVLENSLNIITILNSGKIIKNAAEKASRVIIALKNYVHEDQLEKRTMVDIRYQIEMCSIKSVTGISRRLQNLD